MLGSPIFGTPSYRIPVMRRKVYGRRKDRPEGSYAEHPIIQELKQQGPKEALNPRKHSKTEKLGPK